MLRTSQWRRGATTFTPPPWWNSGRPIGGIGDSLMAGHNGFITALEGGPSGDPAYQPLYQMGQAYGAGFSFVNCGVGSTGASALGGELDSLLPSNPIAIFVHTGVNDLAGGAVFGDVSATYDTAVGRMQAIGAHVFWDQIWPATSLDDTQSAARRTWNTALIAWCAGNGCTLMSTQTALGQLRVSTGQLDDLKTAYNSGDNIHLNLSGYTYVGGTLWKGAADAYYA